MVFFHIAWTLLNLLVLFFNIYTLWLYDLRLVSFFRSNTSTSEYGRYQSGYNSNTNNSSHVDSQQLFSDYPYIPDQTLSGSNYGHEQPLYGLTRPYPQSMLHPFPPIYGSNHLNGSYNMPHTDSQPMYGPYPPYYGPYQSSYGSSDTQAGKNRHPIPLPPNIYDPGMHMYGSNPQNYGSSQPAFEYSQGQFESTQPPQGSSHLMYALNNPMYPTPGSSMYRHPGPSGGPSQPPHHPLGGGQGITGRLGSSYADQTSEPRGR